MSRRIEVMAIEVMAIEVMAIEVMAVEVMAVEVMRDTRGDGCATVTMRDGDT